MKLGLLEFYFWEFFFNFNFFHVFLVKVLNIISIGKNRNMHIFYKKKFQSGIKTFFGGLVETLQFLLVK